MHIGGPFDTIKGPTVFLYKRLHNVYISFFLFNVTTNNTCHLKMHHSRPLKKKVMAEIDNFSYFVSLGDGRVLIVQTRSLQYL